EPDEDARQRALEQYGIVVQSSGHLFGLTPHQFHAITLWHVLEHVAMLDEYLQQFAKLLLPEGVLIVAVPNYTSYEAAYYGEYWAAYDVPRHFHHFSPASMKVLAERNGYSLLRTEPMWLDAFYISLLSERYRHGNSRWISAFCRGLMSNWVAWWNKDRCSSLVYVLKVDVAK
ncbi:MAG TPA: class I SAM-dependent methyltransferase, partial [Phnomibacter sp.]|nr:class I SAM-dependent methyltransferase [Phnomibacter sp.]